MTEYDVAKAHGRCAVSGRPIAEGEIFYTALVPAGEGFERRDYSAECWQGPPPEAVCHFKTRLPRKEEARKTLVDNEVLVNFFLRLADTPDEVKLRFRFVLALILLRKRLLRYESTLREGSAETWELRLMADRSLHRVLNPALDDSQIQELTAELGVILAGHLPDDAGPADAPAPVADRPPAVDQAP
jgi:hypothetical protein